MSAATASRGMFWRTHPQLVVRRSVLRNASTTSQATQKASETASKAKDTASNVTSKASEGLSRVSSSAGSTISKIGSGVGNTIQRIGGRTGRLITFVQSMIPPTIYYSKVGLELSKLVFQGRKMTPPSLAEFQTYFSPILNTLRHPSALLSGASSSSASSPETILSRLRNVDRAQMAAGGVILAEVLGFFTAGEIIGKMKVVGYRGDPHAHEAPHSEGH